MPTLSPLQFRLALALALSERHHWATSFYNAFARECPAAQLDAAIAIRRAENAGEVPLSLIEALSAAVPATEPQPILLPEHDGDNLWHDTSEGLSWDIHRNGRVELSIWRPWLGAPPQVVLAVSSRGAEAQVLRCGDFTDPTYYTRDVEKLEAALHLVREPNADWSFMAPLWNGAHDAPKRAVMVPLAWVGELGVRVGALHDADASELIRQLQARLTRYHAASPKEGQKPEAELQVSLADVRKALEAAGSVTGSLMEGDDVRLTMDLLREVAELK